MRSQLRAILGSRSPSRAPSAFLFAKMRGRRSTLYEGERLRQLAGVGGLVDLHYVLFPGQQPGDQFALERRLQAGCVAELAFLAQYVGGRQRALYDALLDRWRVENLKVLLRLRREGEGAREDGAALIDLPPACALPLDQLTSAGSIEEFLDRIPLAAPRRCALNALPIYQQTGRKAFLEMALDQGYWQNVGECLRALPRRARSACERPVRCEFDAMRLMAVLRAKRVYELEWELLGPLLPDEWGNVGTDALHALFGSRDLGGLPPLLSRVWPRWRASMDAEGAQDLPSLEEGLWHETVRLAERQHYGTLDGFAVLVSYFYLKQEELRHLLSLAQMLSRGADPKDIAAYLEQ